MRVLVADDHRLMLAAVRAALERHSDIEVVEATTEAVNVLPLVADLQPDVVLLDVLMPQLDGLEILDRIRVRFPAVKVVLLSAAEGQELVAEAEKRGANAFVRKEVDPDELVPVLRRALEGGEFEVVGVDPGPGDSARLEAGITKKEQLVLEALARGLSNHQIAQELWVTEQTVKFHLSNIYRKLDVRNRTEAAQHALRRGLVRPGTSQRDR